MKNENLDCRTRKGKGMVRDNIDEKYELMQHTNRVAKLAYRMAKYMKLKDSVCKEITIAAELHDIGKLLIEPQILNKVGGISKEEKKYLENHVTYSYMLSLLLKQNLTEDIVTMIYQHHENNDGSGYPNFLKGGEIHLGSHIIRVCDTYDAMISDRPYRRLMTKNEAYMAILSEIEKYNVKCVEALGEIENIHTKRIMNG